MLNDILSHFNDTTSNTQENLQRVSRAIVDDIEIDKKEDVLFHDRLHDNFGMSDRDIEMFHGPDFNWELDLGEFKKPEFPNNQEKDDVIIEKLEHFFEKLKKRDFPILSNSVIEMWEKDMHDINEVLNGNTQDVNLDAVEKRVVENILLHAPKVETYNPEKHSSIIDYYEMRIEEAKLATHKAALMELYDNWKSNKNIDEYVVLSSIMDIAEKKQIHLL